MLTGMLTGLRHEGHCPQEKIQAQIPQVRKRTGKDRKGQVPTNDQDEARDRTAIIRGYAVSIIR
jgi:hypothetical protein